MVQTDQLKFNSQYGYVQDFASGIQIISCIKYFCYGDCDYMYKWEAKRIRALIWVKHYLKSEFCS